MTAETLFRYLLMLVLAVFMAGMIVKVKAMWAGRYGAPLFQPFFEIIRLFRKSQVISETSSMVSTLGPTLALASVLAAAMVVPVGGGAAIMSFKGDFIFFVYALAAARFFSVIIALDTGGSIGGMGASRVVTFSALIEPAFFII
ncbi:MAG: NADH-quinone oxidoreductase subunit H, partial [Nitrospirae bacterium]|nr:NADH-quinone oxidoreductase subunit H [Nitrospirota bacterium]